MKSFRLIEVLSYRISWWTIGMAVSIYMVFLLNAFRDVTWLLKLFKFYYHLIHVVWTWVPQLSI